MDAHSAGGATLSIGQLAGQARCSVATIRYYEEIGLIPAAARRSSGHRAYPAAAATRLSFIRRCRDLGFSLEEVRALLSLSERADLDCMSARDIAKTNLESVRAKMVEMMALERTLSRFVRECEGTCAGGPAPQCTIFRDLGLSAPAGDQRAGCCGPRA